MNINGIISRVALAGAMLPAAFSAVAEEPIITFHTNVYDNVGETNAFHFYLGAKEPTYVDVDCGFGPIEVEVDVATFDPNAGGIAGTVITGTVSEEGIVRIYGDASKIDYIDMEGCYISDISFPTLTEVEILNLSHNELKALDLSHMSKLQALYLSTNPFDVTPLIVGPNKPDLQIVEMSIIDHLDQSFNLSDYPAMRSFEAWHVPDLTSIDPTNCPGLLRLSVDVTNITSVDVSQNPNLLILNVADTRVTELDLSNNPYLTELYCGHVAAFNESYKMTSLELGSKPSLQRLFCQGNALTSLDISGCPKLINFSCARNMLTSISLDACPNLSTVDISNNLMTFANMPLPRESFTEYYYYQQPMAMARSYAVGTTVDFSDRVLREGSVTQAFLFSVSENDPGSSVMLDPETYTYADGKFTFNQAVADSVVVTFINDIFQDYPLSTAKFMVKSAEDFGKPNCVAEMTFYPTIKNVSFSVGVQGATPESPRTFKVDFGDGNLVDFTATSSDIPATPNVSGTRTGHVFIYMPEGTDISAFAIDGQRLMSIDLTAAHTLAELSITNCQLPTINLTWNRCLTSLDLSGNNLSVLDLSEPNGGYGKNVLNSINASNNRLTEVTFSNRQTIRDLNLSNNNLAEFDLTKLNYMFSVDLSGNQITEVDLRDAEALVSMNLAENYIKTIAIPDYAPLVSVNISGNCFSLTSLPMPGIVPDYVYAPQRPMTLPAKAPTVNLSANYLELDGAVTSYSWVMDATGAPVPDGAIEARGNGRFRFTNPDLGVVRCEMTHPAFPEFTGEKVYTTTAVQTAGMPTHVFATFTTTESADGSIIMTGKTDGTTVYIDWEGTQDLEQYVLASTYIPFAVKTKAGAMVKCYSYDEDEGVTVFSLDNIKMSSIDASPMKGLINFSCSNAGLKAGDITFPACKSTLRELALDSNEIDAIDLSGFNALQLLNLNANKLTAFDATSLSKLQGLYLAYNNLTEVKLNNPSLWECALVGNNLESLDLSKVPGMEQLYLSQNSLSQLDCSAMPLLRSLYIDRNRFTFATLPDCSGLNTYVYGNQAVLEVTPIDGYKVDLSSQVSYKGTPTTYTWYIDSPYFDEEGNLVGENLYEGEEYTIEGGVTKFLRPFSHIMCVMTNEQMPSLVLYTNFIDVVADPSGIDEVVAADALPARWFNLNGVCVAETAPGQRPALAPGIYIRLTTAGATKVAVR